MCIIIIVTLYFLMSFVYDLINSDKYFEHPFKLSDLMIFQEFHSGSLLSQNTLHRFYTYVYIGGKKSCLMQKKAHVVKSTWKILHVHKI